MNELFEEKMKIVLNLIRTNNSADEALKITQAADNLARARNTFAVDAEPKTTKKTGAGA